MNLACNPKDIMIMPLNNTNVQALPEGAVESIRIMEVPVGPWLSTLQDDVGAGFYATVFGPMPYVFGRIPPEQYGIKRIVRPVRSEPQ